MLLRPSLRALLLCVCAWVACASAVSAQQAAGWLPNLLVRTVDHRALVSQGGVNPSWVTGRADGPFQAPQTFFPRYVVVLDANATGIDPPPALTFQLIYSTSDATALDFTANRETVTATSLLYETVVETVCVGTGSSVLTVDLLVGEGGGNATGSVLSWSFERSCTQPQIQVGTRPWTFDVVDSTSSGTGSGVPVVAPAWASSAMGSDVQPYILGPDVAQMDLYLYLANSVSMGTGSVVAPFDLTVTSASETDVSVAGYSYNGTDATSPDAASYAIFDSTNPISTLSIPLACTHARPVLSATLISVVLSYHWPSSQGDLEFVFIKQCNDAARLRTLSLGTSARGSDIVAGGMVLPGYSPPLGTGLAPNDLFGAAQRGQFVFHACLACGNNAPALAQPFNLTWSNSYADTLIVGVPSFPEGAAEGSYVAGALLPGVDMPFRLDVLCVQPGGGSVSFQLALLGGGSTGSFAYDPLEFVATFTCPGLPLFDMGYVVLPGGEGGNHPEWALVMDDSQVSQAWTNGSVIAGPKEDVSTFFLVQDAVSPRPPPNDVPQQFYKFSFVLPSSSSAAMPSPPQIDDAQKGIATVTSLQSGLPIHFRWGCAAGLKADVTVPVTIVLSYGWASTTQPLRLQLLKVCPAGGPSSGGKSHGWSGAGIFFFTLFILTLVVCIGGGAFNYKYRNKRGLAALPGHDAALACYERVRESRPSERNWTPQMNAEQTGALQQQYGTLGGDGDAYQSNL